MPANAGRPGRKAFSSGLPARGLELQANPTASRAGFDVTVAGRLAECDGGGPIAGTRFATREEFAGTLTGEYVDHGDPPWRWYLMVNLVRRPDGYSADAVWCESGNLFFLDE